MEVPHVPYILFSSLVSLYSASVFKKLTVLWRRQICPFTIKYSEAHINTGMQQILWEHRVRQRFTKKSWGNMENFRICKCFLHGLCKPSNFSTHAITHVLSMLLNLMLRWEETLISSHQLLLPVEIHIHPWISQRIIIINFQISAGEEKKGTYFHQQAVFNMSQV